MKFILAIILISFYAVLNGQISVKGTIKDLEDKQGLPHASVYIDTNDIYQNYKSQKFILNTTTDFYGNFNLQIPDFISFNLLVVYPGWLPLIINNIPVNNTMDVIDLKNIYLRPFNKDEIINLVDGGDIIIIDVKAEKFLDSDTFFLPYPDSLNLKNFVLKDKALYIDFDDYINNYVP